MSKNNSFKICPYIIDVIFYTDSDITYYMTKDGSIAKTTGMRRPQHNFQPVSSLYAEIHYPQFILWLLSNL